jgi:hypothetical protein
MLTKCIHNNFLEIDLVPIYFRSTDLSRNMEANINIVDKLCEEHGVAASP